MRAAGKNVHVILLTALCMPSIAFGLPPINPPGNFERVCNLIPELKATAETVITHGRLSQSAKEHAKIYEDQLFAFAFGRDTRATVDANDIEGPLAAFEHYLNLNTQTSEEELEASLRYSLIVLSATYGCEDWKWRNEFE